MNPYTSNSCLMPMPIIRIEKSSLRTIIGKTLQYRTPVRKHVIHSSSCHFCVEGILHEKLTEEYMSYSCEKQLDIQKIRSLKERIETIDHMCLTSGCSKCRIKKEYQNDKKEYHLYSSMLNINDHRIPKNAIRLFLLLYALPQNMLGNSHFIRNLSAAKMAEYLSCTISTVKRCLNILESSGYITLSHASDLSHYNIILNHYDTMHLTAEKGGSGYITLDRNALEALLSIKHVNQLRLEILCLLRYDNARRSEAQNTFPIWENYSFFDLKNMLSSHMNYHAKFEHILNSPYSLFNSYINDKKIYFSLKEVFALRFDYEKLLCGHQEILQQCFLENDILLKENDMLSLAEMATQYDIELILHCTCRILKRYHSPTKIRNLPGLVRRYCANLALGNLAVI